MLGFYEGSLNYLVWGGMKNLMQLYDYMVVLGRDFPFYKCMKFGLVLIY